MKRKPSTSDSVSKATGKKSPVGGSRHLKEFRRRFVADSGSVTVTLTPEEIAQNQKRTKVVARLRAKYPNRVIYVMSDEILNSLDENDPVWPFEEDFE